MGLGNFIDRYEHYPVSKEEVEAAEEVFPDLWQGRVAMEYRLLILREFVKRDGEPLKRGENGAYRTRDETRFDRAVYAVSEAVEREGRGTVVKCALGMYEESDGATEKFIDDLGRIEDRLD